jgi:hypothetical protein
LWLSSLNSMSLFTKKSPLFPAISDHEPSDIAVYVPSGLKSVQSVVVPPTFRLSDVGCGFRISRIVISHRRLLLRRVLLYLTSLRNGQPLSVIMRMGLFPLSFQWNLWIVFFSLLSQLSFASFTPLPRRGTCDVHFAWTQMMPDCFLLSLRWDSFIRTANN